MVLTGPCLCWRSCCCQIFYLTSTSTLSVLNASFSYDNYSTSHPTFSSLDDDYVATLVYVCVTSRVDYCGSLLIGSPKKTNRLKYAQVRPGTRSFPAKWATLAGRCRQDSVQSLRSGVQVSAQHICPLSANLSPAFLFAAICDQLTVVTWTSLVSHYINPLSNATLRPVSSLSISTCSAFGVLLEQSTI